MERQNLEIRNIMNDKVSVIIPTRNRPHLVSRAVRSALAQTYKEIEVIVVLDGPNDLAFDALKEFDDSRMKVLVLPENVGPSGARNAGAQAAEGPWIAFLDDDDEWSPFKLEKQINAASLVNAPFPVIASYVLVRTPARDMVQPGRVPGPDEPVCEYLFCRPSFFRKEGSLQTSTLVMKKALFERIPFRREVVPHEDQDLVLRAAKMNGVCIEVVPEPLSIWHIGKPGENLSSRCNWKYSLQWLRGNCDLVTPRAYAGFVATTVADQASRQRDWKAFVSLIREIRRFGAPGARVYLVYLLMWFVPTDVRHRVRSLFGPGLPPRARHASGLPGASSGAAAPLKIAVIGLRGFPDVIGGVETHAENLYPRIAARGCEVTVFTRKSYVDPDINEYEGVRLVPLACLRNKYFEAFLHTFLAVFAARRIRPDILHIHAVGPSLFVPVARLLGMKVVMTHHGPDYERQKWGGFARFALRMGERLGCKWADGIICISGQIAEMLRLKYGRDPVIIPNGVNMPAGGLDLGNPEKYGVEKGKYILAVGRFVPEKGFHDLLKAFRLMGERKSFSDETSLRQTQENWKLLIVGDTVHDDAYSTSVKAEAHGNDGVVLAGALSGEELQEVYAHAGLFVLPSYYEGLPIVLLEAMSHGLSCILSDIPANRNIELARDRYFQAGDVEGLALKMREFMDSPLSPQARQDQIRLVTERFAWGGIAAKTQEVYRSITRS